ncbi:FKBP-type peptidyl-prolyl cis-trans isomerase (rotamase) [Serratia symbiotica str. 'Cinara cedri']|nr:FKBP-type peptidyl-prolyl cis-trans isomerase (rotamase) [Serratia symbiotica str. 'Cinara cedri']
MKSLFKITLLATMIILTIQKTHATADNQKTQKNITFKNDNDQAAYALGASFGRYINHSLKDQEKLGIKLDKNQFISGIQDVFDNKNQLSDTDIERTLQNFAARVKSADQVNIEREAKQNETKGIKYRDFFAKIQGVEKTQSGLLYKIERPGTGVIPKDNDTILVHYNGTLIDGTEFDNSYTNGKPLSFRLNNVIPGWTEGLKYIKKGGKIKLVIPPILAYGKINVPGIPANSTLVFDVELLDVQEAPQADTKAIKEDANKK